MPSLNYKLSDFLWSLKQFFSTSRTIHAAFPAITIFAFFRIIFEYQKAIGYQPNVDAIRLGIFSLLTMAFAFIVCSLGSFMILKFKPGFWIAKYLTVIGVAVSPIALFVQFSLNVSYSESVTVFFRLVILVSVTESIAGFLISNIKKRSQELESHQESLVLAEENFRASVSTHLHDNLQTRLVAIGIQLNQLREVVDDEASRKILSVISDVESVRSHEVRDFSKSISPNIQQEGLEVCVERLLSNYKNVLCWELHNMPAFDVDVKARERFGLGAYRIIEQALLNSLAHGKASRFDVHFNRSDKELKFEIVNNGYLYDPHNSNQGHGFAVIDAWVHKLGGTWTISNDDDKVVVAITWQN
jgi:glucose-6-phosphate-specific signal transduction histidine kinase